MRILSFGIRISLWQNNYLMSLFLKMSLNGTLSLIMITNIIKKLVYSL